MAYSLTDVDTIRERLGVGYAAAVEALQESEGEVAQALAVAETRQQETLAELSAQVKEGVTRVLRGDTIGVIRWKVRDQVVGERPVSLAGIGAVVVGVLSVLISSSAIETGFAGHRRDGEPGS